MIKYEILSSQSTVELSQKVNKFIEEGFIAYGSPSCSTILNGTMTQNIFIQAMIKDDDTK